MREHDDFVGGVMIGGALIGAALFADMQRNRLRAAAYGAAMAEAEGELVDALLDESALLTRLLDIRLAQLEALG